MKKVFLSLLLFAAFCILTIQDLSSQNSSAEIKDDLPKMLGGGIEGTDFWLTVPPCFQDESSGPDNYIHLFVTCAVQSVVYVEVPGKSFATSKKTIPNGVIEFKIIPATGQPYTKMGKDPEIVEKVYKGNGLHVYCDQSIILYCVIRFKYLSDGFLVIPSSSLGSEYIIAGFQVDPMFQLNWQYLLPNITGIVAAHDNTRVKFTLGGNAQTRTAGNLRPGESSEVTLNIGDVWMISTKGDNSDLSGSKVAATKPVAVITGNQCVHIPVGNRYCDYIAEMDLPSNMWGKEIPVPKVPGRKYASMIKVFAKEVNTKVYRDGKLIGELFNSGGVEGLAYYTLRVTEDLTPFSSVFTGDKPINIMFYNCGVNEDGLPRPKSDPFSMAMLPVNQYMNEVTFFTPGISGGNVFPDNYINLVYETDQNGKMPDDLQITIDSSGKQVWRKIRTEFADPPDEIFKYTINKKKYALKLIKLPYDGIYKIRSSKPFGAYSFGFDESDSYGFPSGSSFYDLEKPDTAAPVLDYNIGCCGSLSDAAVTDMPEDPTVRSNLGIIYFHTDSSYNYNFSYVQFIPGQTRTTTWNLNVIDCSKDAFAKVSFSDRVGNETIARLKYNAPKILIEPGLIDFGLLSVGDSLFKHFTFINNNQQPFDVVKVDMVQKNQNFSVDLLGTNLPARVKDSLKMMVKFIAAGKGNYIDTIAVFDSCSGFNKCIVKCSVTEEKPKIALTDIDFGKTMTSEPKTNFFDITNDGFSDLIITGRDGPYSGVFTTDFPAVDSRNPLILRPRSKLTFGVTFKTTIAGKFSDSIIFATNAAADNKRICLINGEAIPNLITEEELKTMGISFNNPVIADLIILNTGNEQITALKLFNNSGLKLMDIKVNAPDDKNKYTVRMENYPKGIYFLQLFTAGKDYFVKFIKTE